MMSQSSSMSWRNLSSRALLCSGPYVSDMCGVVCWMWGVGKVRNGGEGREGEVSGEKGKVKKRRGEKGLHQSMSKFKLSIPMTASACTLLHVLQCKCIPVHRSRVVGEERGSFDCSIYSHPML